jgi:sugar phosphate isomerase/epimerase
MKQRLPFSVNHYLCPPDTLVLDFLDRISEHGFTSVGLTERALEGLPIAQLRREIAARELGISSVNSAGFFLLNGDAARSQAVRNNSLLQKTADLGDVGLNVIVGGSKELPISVARQRATEELARFAERANELGVRLLIEPLHPLNARTKSCFNTISQIETVFGLIPNLSLNVDLFHLWWDPDLDRVVRGESVPVGILQFCDVGGEQADGLARRLPLGEGFAPWAEQIELVRTAFVSAPIELELFANQLPDRSLEDILARSAALLATSDRP